MMLYIFMKFHENIFYGFQDIERTRFCDRPTEGQMARQELWFLSSASGRMMLYLSMRFLENVLNGFQGIERTLIDHCQISTWNISRKTDYTRVTVLVVCMLSNNALYFYEVS